MRSALLVLCLAALTALGAALFRLRGSSSFAEWTGRGIGTARWMWAAALGLAAWLVDDGTASAWSARFYLLRIPPLDGPLDGAWTLSLPVLLPALVVALYLGAVAGWWRSLDLGTREGTVAGDLALHSLRGLLWTGPAAMVLSLAGLASPWPLLIAGLFCGPLYFVCRRLWPWYAVEAGEWAFGAAIAAALLCSVAFT